MPYSLLYDAWFGAVFAGVSGVLPMNFYEWLAEKHDCKPGVCDKCGVVEPPSGHSKCHVETNRRRLNHQCVFCSTKFGWYGNRKRFNDTDSCVDCRLNHRWYVGYPTDHNDLGMAELLADGQREYAPPPPRQRVTFNSADSEFAESEPDNIFSLDASRASAGG